MKSETEDGRGAQKEAVECLLRAVEQQSKLLETLNKKPCTYWQFYIFLLTILVLYLFKDEIKYQMWFVILFVIIALAGLIEKHSLITNRRIDALAQLYDRLRSSIETAKK